MSQFYLLTIEIQDSLPLIWRRIYVPAEITLDRLHDVIQIVFGWSGSDSYCYKINNTIYSNSMNREYSLNTGKCRLKDIASAVGANFKYIYDLDATWTHEILVEETDYFIQTTDDVIKCTNGDMASPLEDIGGIEKYNEFCKAIFNPNHNMRSEYVLWYSAQHESKSHDPNSFDIISVNKELKKFVCWSSDRLLDWKK